MAVVGALVGSGQTHLLAQKVALVVADLVLIGVGLGLASGDRYI